MPINYNEEYSDKVKFRDTTDRRPASVYRGEPIDIEGKFNPPAQPTGAPAISALSQLVEGAAKERNEEADNQERMETGRAPRKPAGGMGGELAILLGGLAGAAIGGGGLEEFYPVVDKKLTAHQVRQDKLNAHFAKSRAKGKAPTPLKASNFLKITDPKTGEGKFVQADDYAGQGIYEKSIDLTGKLEAAKQTANTKYRRAQVDKVGSLLKPIEAANLKAENAFELLGTGQLQDKVALMSIIKNLEGRMSDADRDYYSNEISLLKSFMVTIGQQKEGQLNPRLLQEAEAILRSSITKNNSFIDFKIEEFNKRMKGEKIEVPEGTGPSRKPYKMNETKWLTDPNDPDNKIRLKRVGDDRWEAYGE